jgi:hypothetical protein
MINKTNNGIDLGIIEQGNIYFACRSFASEKNLTSSFDIHSFYMVLNPLDMQKHRILQVCSKKLPSHKNSAHSFAYVTSITRSPKELREFLNEHNKEHETNRKETTVTSAGAGVYYILKHYDHTHLAYNLSLPGRLGSLHKRLQIEMEGNLMIGVKNPKLKLPKGARLRSEKKASYPQSLQKNFRDKKFLSSGITEYLNHEGAEIMMTSSPEIASEQFKINVDDEREKNYIARVFRDLRLERTAALLEPLKADASS